MMYHIQFIFDHLVLLHITQRIQKDVKEKEIDYGLANNFQTIFRIFSFSFSYFLFTLPSLWPSHISLRFIFQYIHPFPSFYKKSRKQPNERREMWQKGMKRDTKFTIIVFIFIGFCGCCASVHRSALHRIASLFDVIACNQW